MPRESTVSDARTSWTGHEVGSGQSLARAGAGNGSLTPAQTEFMSHDFLSSAFARRLHEPSRKWMTRLSGYDGLMISIRASSWSFETFFDLITDLAMFFI